MAKSGLIRALAHTTGTTKKDAEAILDHLPAALLSTVKSGEAFTLPGVGIFKAKAKAMAARKARNPITGAEVDVPAKTKLAFKPAKAMTDALA